MIDKIKDWNALTAARFNDLGGDYALAVTPIRFGAQFVSAPAIELTAVWFELEGMTPEQLTAFQKELREQTQTIWLTNGGKTLVEPPRQN